MIKETIATLSAGQDLTEKEAQMAMGEILTGQATGRPNWIISDGA